MTATATAIDQALAHIDLGFAVFPLGKGTKRPITPHGKDDATTDPAKARTMLSAKGAGNYGLALLNGETRSLVMVIDLDDGDGATEPWQARLKRLVADLGPLPATRQTSTPSGGRHAFFTWSNDVPVPKGDHALGFTMRWPGKHYLVGPGSVVDGREYQSNNKAIAELPRTWTEAIVAECERPRSTESGEAGGYRLPDQVGAGGRYAAIRDYVASRYKRGLSRTEILTLVRAELAPRFDAPLSEPELQDRFDRAWSGIEDRLGQPFTYGESWTGNVAAGSATVDMEMVYEDANPFPAPPDPVVYHGVLGDIARAVAPYTEADPVALLGTLLTMFGAACGASRRFYQGSMQRANISVLLVGATSSGRKGTSLSVGRRVFELAYPHLGDLWLVGLASGEGLTGHLERKLPEERVLIVESEFGRALTIMNREGSTLSSQLRNAWDGQPLGHSRSRDESLVTNHHVALLGHITPTELHDKLRTVDAANGFANRMLFLAVRREQLVPFPQSPDPHVLPYIEPLKAAITTAHQPRDIEFDAGAREAWVGFYEAMASTPRLGLAGAATGRLEAQVARLALVYALADGADAIGAVHLMAAIELADFARRSTIWSLGDSTGDPHADALRTMLPAKWDEAKRELGLRTAADMERVVGVLVDAGVAEVGRERRKGGGRPPRWIRRKGTKGAKDARPRRTETASGAT